MLLSYDELQQLVVDGVINNVYADQINSTSIDITLGQFILVETELNSTVSLKNREPLNTYKYDLIKEGYFDLLPGEFILAHSRQEFNLPNNISAEYKLKSSMARIGLEHLNAGWCDAGWNGSVLTLELKNMTNYNTIRLHHNDRIGQIVFFKHMPVKDENSYANRGRYNNDKCVSGVKL